ncbi:MAG: GAF domain-containing protein, partial [Roseibium sp.]
ASLFDNPDATSPEIALAQRCLRHLTIAAFLYNQRLFPVIVGTSVRLSLQHGNSPESALFFANYGLVLGAFMGRYKEGMEFGRLAMRLCDKFQGQAPTATVCLVHGVEIIPWVLHVREAIKVVDRGYYEGLNSGDILWAGYLVMYRVLLDTFAGRSLDRVLDAIPDQLGFATRTQNRGAEAGIQAHQIVLSTLAGRTKSSTDFSAGDIDEATYLRSCDRDQLAMAKCLYNILKAQALYLFGRPSEALRATEEIETSLSFIVNHPNLADHLLYQSLSLSALYVGGESEQAVAALEKIRGNLAQLTVWSDNCPDNFLAKRLLVEAELARITEDESAAADLYDSAIDAAQKSRILQDEALANELAARFMMERRPKSRVGAMYLRDARHTYQLWGAERKVEELELEFPQLLTEYRDARTAHLPITETLVSTTRADTTLSASSVLDIETMTKAAQTISGEVLLPRLLDRLLAILIENAGAQRGVLLLARAGKLYVDAEASVLSDEASVLLALPLDSEDGARLVPKGVINYVARTKEVIVLADAQQDGRFMVDPYIQSRETRSVLCHPIMHQGELIGLAYLENDLVDSAFTPDSVRLLSLLSGQIAISINNAELVENLEDKVRERTEQLEVHSRFIEQTFGRYLSSEVADRLLRSADGLDFSGRKGTVTVLLSDLRGFATFSDVLPPETIVKLLNNYLSEMTTVIQKYNGTIDAFIGDAILTVFGAPLQRPDDAERAVA